MSDRRKHEWELSALYLELAAECFNRSGAVDNSSATETFKRMGYRYFVEAAALNPMLRLNSGRPPEDDRTGVKQPGRRQTDGPRDTLRDSQNEIQRRRARSKDHSRTISSSHKGRTAS